MGKSKTIEMEKVIELMVMKSKTIEKVRDEMGKSEDEIERENGVVDVL